VQSDRLLPAYGIKEFCTLNRFLKTKPYKQLRRSSRDSMFVSRRLSCRFEIFEYCIVCNLLSVSQNTFHGLTIAMKSGGFALSATTGYDNSNR
jgi:hypothetical protein